MYTSKQKKTVEVLVGSGRAGKTLSKADVLREAGYSPAVVDSPGKVFDSKGFIEVCEEAGLTDDFLAKCLAEDIRLKPQNRKGELELAYKIKGKLKDQNPQGDTTNNLILVANEEQISRIARRALNGNSSSS